MREIKFRAWEPLSKKYHYMDFCLYEGDEKKLFALPMGRQSLRDSYTAMNLDNLVIEQFTGVYDKNGKEIYEGDVLKNPDYEEAFVVEYHEGMAGYIGWGDDKIAGCYLITGDEIEIIGNIHENPELLEGRE